MPQRPQYANIAILCPALQVRAAALKGVFWMGTEFMTFCRWAPAGQNNMSVGPGQGNVMPGHDNTEHTLNITKQNNRRCLSDVITSNNGPLRQLGTNVSLSWDWDNCHLMLTANINLHCALRQCNQLLSRIHSSPSKYFLFDSVAMHLCGTECNSRMYLDMSDISQIGRGREQQNMQIYGS